MGENEKTIVHSFYGSEEKIDAFFFKIGSKQ